MPFNDKIQDEIERFVDGQMDDTESIAFKEKCKMDEDYKRQWSSYILLNTVAKSTEMKRFATYDKSLKRERKRNWIVGGGVLLFIFLVSVFVYFNQSKHTILTSEEKREFAEQFSTPEKSIILENNKISTRKTSSLTNEADRKELQIAIDNFYAGEYEKSINTLEGLTKYNPRLLRANFYIGVAQMELKNYEVALVEFENILDGLDIDGNEDLLEETYWYKSLTLLAIGKKEEATGNLELLTEFSTKYEEKATALIEKIK